MRKDVSRPAYQPLIGLRSVELAIVALRADETLSPALSQGERGARDSRAVLFLNLVVDKNSAHLASRDVTFLEKTNREVMSEG